MQYVVIAMVEDHLEARVAKGANQALLLGVRYREHGYERVTFTDGVRFFTLEQMEAMTDASRP
jgi:hypothetical protein